MVRQKIKKTFNIQYLQEIANQENSCVELQRKTLHMTVHPYQLKNFESSLKELLSRRIARYNKQLGGILLGYDNLALETSAGFINNDNCFMHIDIQADFYIFKPEIGKFLKGIVNKKSRSHLGCLVYQLFNVSLPSEEGDDGWMGDSVSVGQEIMFRITDTNLNRKLPYIQGNIISILADSDSGISTGEEIRFADDDSTYEEIVKQSKKKKKREQLGDHESNQSIEFEQQETATKQKKKKRQSFEENYTEEIVEQDTPKRKKKHQKKISVLEQSCSIDIDIKQEEYPKKQKKRHSEEEDTGTIIDTPVSSNKKRKRRSMEGEQAEVGVDISPKKKKHKKMNILL